MNLVDAGVSTGGADKVSKEDIKLHRKWVENNINFSAYFKAFRRRPEQYLTS